MLRALRLFACLLSLLLCGLVVTLVARRFGDHLYESWAVATDSHTVWGLWSSDTIGFCHYSKWPGRPERWYFRIRLPRELNQAQFDGRWWVGAPGGSSAQWSFQGLDVRRGSACVFLQSDGDVLRVPPWPENPMAGPISSPMPYFQFGAPPWMLIVLFGLYPTFEGVRAVWRPVRHRHRLRQCRCPRCGYDLRYTRTRCPECGQVVDPARLPAHPLPPTRVQRLGGWIKRLPLHRKLAIASSLLCAGLAMARLHSRTWEDWPLDGAGTLLVIACTTLLLSACPTPMLQWSLRHWRRILVFALAITLISDAMCLIYQAAGHPIDWASLLFDLAIAFIGVWLLHAALFAGEWAMGLRLRSTHSE